MSNNNSNNNTTNNNNSNQQQQSSNSLLINEAAACAAAAAYGVYFGRTGLNLGQFAGAATPTGKLASPIQMGGLHQARQASQVAGSSNSDLSDEDNLNGEDSLGKVCSRFLRALICCVQDLQALNDMFIVSFEGTRCGAYLKMFE